MNRKQTLLLIGSLLLLTILTLLWQIPRTVTLLIDDQPQTLRTTALTVGAALARANIAIGPQDTLEPAPTTLLRPGMQIHLQRARQVWLWVEPEAQRYQLLSHSRQPAEWLSAAGVSLGKGDQLLFNSQVIDPQVTLPPQPAYLLQVRRAIPIQVQLGDQTQAFSSSAATLGQALWQNGVQLGTADRLSLPSNTPLRTPLQVTLQRATPLTIQVQGQTIQAASAAETIGEALAEIGLPLLGLDYSIPAADQPLPGDGQIRIVRVHETLTLQQKLIPYGKQYVADPNTELDQRSIVTPGQFGVELTRERQRYEDGQQVASLSEESWLISPPVDEKIGYGTQVVVRTLDTPNGPIEYWRAVNVYITSYSPCGQGNRSFCNDITASGLTLRRGIIAVDQSWYGWMAGQQLYVPDYGIGLIADWGYGFSDKYWIDLGYSEDDYVSWSSYRTIYFLTPVPENIPWILP
ncbi:MAG: ubiquitin-like domain-containing protein [Anaerolinea sp.]|nr:ubiquitin-like domain-containing protein [Anaerolinea sp.]